MRQVDAAIIGGGPAGLAAAIRLYEQGITNILIFEREKNLGGILRQCIHDGFGLRRFGETLSGPEYAARFSTRAEELGIPCLTDTTVLNITPDKTIYASSKGSYEVVKAKSIILAMGCRERTRGALSIPGERPSGIYTAGVAQSYINLHNKMVGKEIVILGSGDIGMIMSRRLTLEGAHVIGVFEVMPYPSGLPRNIVQCLDDYGIPLSLSHSVTDIKGRERLESVTISEIGPDGQPVPGTEVEYPCDTLILSVGLIPENELSIGAGVELDNGTKGAVVDNYYRTSVDGIFAAGNVLHVHDLVDFVSLEAEALADSVARYIKDGSLPAAELSIVSDGNAGAIIPQKFNTADDFTVYLRVRRPLGRCEIQLVQGDTVVTRRKMPKALPAEMIQIPVKAAMLSADKNLEVKVIC